MFYYTYNKKILFSNNLWNELSFIKEEEAAQSDQIIYYLNHMDPHTSRKTFSLSHPAQLFDKTESLDLIKQKSYSYDYPVPHWMYKKIQNRSIMVINTGFPDFIQTLHKKSPKKWNINIAGLGDVGGSLLVGLRLLGGNCINRIGIFDYAAQKQKRWLYEGNQIYYSENHSFPPICELTEEELFDCDMFIFCVAVRVPPVGEENADVRMTQFTENANIIKYYTKKARKSNFKGIFSVVSDPVDLLCRVVYEESNLNEKGDFDFAGLAPEQIRGYGLGIMNARAVFYSKQNPKTLHYEKEGRAFGPHGEGLIIADSIEKYNEELSEHLTEKAKYGNIEIRKTGFKPYIGPALSSGSLSVIATIKGDWQYSATYVGGVYMGAKNRLNLSGTEIERLNLPDSLYVKIQKVYKDLQNFK